MGAKKQRLGYFVYLGKEQYLNSRHDDAEKLLGSNETNGEINIKSCYIIKTLVLSISYKWVLKYKISVRQINFNYNLNFPKILEDKMQSTKEMKVR